MDNIYNSIQTNVTEGMTVNTYVQDTPQVQTVLQDGTTPISTIVNAPFVAVTSVNGMTGDVITTVVVGDFIPNHYYVKGTFISYNGQNYLAKENFTAGATFNENDWFTVAGKDGLMGAKVDGDILELMNTIVVDQSNYYTKTEVDEKISQIDLVDYVKKTDYATTTNAGVVKIVNDFGVGVYDNNGTIAGSTRTYEQYGSAYGRTVISKGTLENVITGKGLVSNTDIASDSQAGVVKVQTNNLNYGVSKTSDGTLTLYSGTEENITSALSTNQRNIPATTGNFHYFMKAKNLHSTHTLTQTELDAQAAAGTLVEGDWYGVTGA